MTLASVSTRANNQPIRVLLHGLEGVGKTTFAGSAPSPIFLCPEDGIPRTLGEVAHFPAPQGGWTWPDVLDAVRELATEAHDYRTLVIDTLDWLEPLLWKSLCERSGVDGIEEVGGGYGKGYTAALDGWRTLIAELEQLRRAKGMQVIALAHTWIRAFKNPEGDDFDRYELKINNKAAGLWKEWTDAVLFARHDDVAAKDAKTKRVRGVSTGVRVIMTVHHAAYDAKNRFDLPEQLPLDWTEFEAAVTGGTPVATLKTAIAEGLKELAPADAETVKGYLGRAGDDPARLNQLINLINSKKGA